MDIQSQKLELMRLLLNTEEPSVLSRIKEVFTSTETTEEELLKEKMVSRALRAEEDIKEGRIMSIDEAEKRLNERFGS